MKPIGVMMMVVLVGGLVATGGAEPLTPEQQAEAALERASGHLSEAFRALKEAGSLLYHDKVPVIQEKSHRMLEGIMEEAQGLMKDLHDQLKSQLPPPPKQAPPPGYSAPGGPSAPPPGGRDRFI